MSKSELARAIAVLGITKGELMRATFKNDASGIDSALPQGVVNSRGLAYGARVWYKELSFMVTDCRENKYAIVNMLYLIPSDIAHALMFYADICADIARGKYSFEDDEYTRAIRVVVSRTIDAWRNGKYATN